MKLRDKAITPAFALTALVLVTSSQAQNSNYQPLGFTAGSYDIFTLSGTGTGNGVTQMDWDDEGNFDGRMGFGVNAEFETGSDLIVGSNGDIRRHSTVDPSADASWDATMHPSATLAALGIHDAELVTVDSQIETYITQLNTLTTTNGSGGSLNSFGDWDSGDDGAFSAASTGSLNVIDFTSLTMAEGSFTLNGGGSGNDVFIIRIATDTIFEGGGKKGDGAGVPVILNNLDRRNVVWLTADGGEFDLHQNGGAIFEGVVINPTPGSGKNSGTIIGNVDFTGQVYAGSMKLGTGVVFEGSSITDPIPEPTSGILLLCSLGSFVFLRRRT